jgi:hypothetical protein
MTSIERVTLRWLTQSLGWVAKPPDTAIWMVNTEFRHLGWWQNHGQEITSGVYVRIGIGLHTLARRFSGLGNCSVDDAASPLSAGVVFEDSLGPESEAMMQDGVEFHFDTGAAFTVLRGDLALKLYSQLEPSLVTWQTLVLADERVVTCPKGPIAISLFGEWVEVPCCFLLAHERQQSWWRDILHVFRTGKDNGQSGEKAHLLGMTDFLALHLFCVTSTGIHVFRRPVVKLQWRSGNSPS